MGHTLMAAHRLAEIRESFIREMSRLAITHQAVNLSQGFPDFDPPPEALAAAHRALDEGYNQYAIPWGVPALRQTKGHHIDRQQFQNMLDEYYAERGWDNEGCVPSTRQAEIDALAAKCS